MKVAKLKFTLFVLLLAASIIIAQYNPDAFSYPVLKETVAKFGIWSWFAFLIFWAVCGIIIVPGTVPVLLGALLFGPWVGSLLNLIGSIIAATIAYYAAKILGRQFVQELLVGRFEGIQHMVEQKGFRIIFVLRLIPVIPFFTLNYAAGLSRIHLAPYFWGSLLGLIAPILAYTYVLAKLGDKALTTGITLKDLATPEILIPGTILFLLLAIPIVFRKTLR